MRALGSPSHCAVAFSGGPDSLALLFLAARWMKRRKGKLVALTVDHGLRKGSGVEAKRAGQMARALGVSHRILKWKGDKPKAGVQAAAREARYALMMEAMRKEGCDALLVAHHLEDQAETFLMRLARGSGVDGLSAMGAARSLGQGVHLLRPLLDIRQARLKATLEKAGLQGIEDPSNQNERFERVKLRKQLPALEALGMDAEGLVRTAAHLARARAALETSTRVFLKAHAQFAPEAYVRMDVQALLEAPQEIALRALNAVLKAVAGNFYAPRFEALEALYAAIATSALGAGRTLHGCKVAQGSGRKNHHLLITRESAAAEMAVPLLLKKGQEGVWDGRFLLRLVKAPGPRAAVEVRALGDRGLSQLRKAKRLPAEGARAAWPALPGLWQAGRLLAAPHFGWAEPGFDVISKPVEPLFEGFSP